MVIKKNFSLNLIILSGLLLRLIFATQHQVWHDEIVTLSLANTPLFLFFKNAALDNHPPLYFLIIKFLNLFLSDILLLRLSSVFFGVLSLWIAFRFFLVLGANNSTASLVTAFMAFSPVHIYYSVELRMYGLLVFETLLIGLATINLLKAKNSLSNFFYIIIATLALYTHYYAILPIISITFIILVKFKKIVFRWFNLNSIVFLLFSPWLFLTIQSPKPDCWCFSPVSGLWATFASFAIGNVGKITIFHLLKNLPVWIIAIYSIIALFFFVLYLLSWQKHKTRLFWTLQALLLIPIVIVFIISFFRPLFSPRSFIFLSPLYYSIIAGYLTDKSTRFGKYLIFISLFSLLLAVFLNNLYSQ